jgi:molecular chaperone IbpA
MSTMTSFALPATSYTIPTASFVGFGRLLEDFYRIQPQMTNYPPHNVVEIDDDNFLVELAVAGFSENEIDIQIKDSLLTINGEKEPQDSRKYAHKGISSREFTKAFTLGEHVQVKEATLRDGILAIYLERIIPEELRPRKITINTATTKKPTVLNG